MKMMKISVLVLTVSLFANTWVHGQIRAITEKGDTIYVYNNGTWSFTLEDTPPEAPGALDYLSETLTIDTIKTPFVFNKNANKEITTELQFFKIKYDEKAWDRVPPGDYNENAEFAFKSNTRDIYCIVIPEELEIGNENILKIALNSFKENTGGEVEILKIEQRTVNGVEVLRGVFKMEISGLNLIFDSYYYSSTKGTVQFTTWTAVNIWEKYESEILNLLNGLVILDN